MTKRERLLNDSLKILITFLAFFLGGYMLLDGVFVLNKGKYIGPERPGPWTILFEKLAIDVFSLGSVFVLFGCCWILWIIGFWTRQSWGYPAGIILGILTLWYLPFGTIMSLVIVFILITKSQQLGLKAKK